MSLDHRTRLALIIKRTLSREQLQRAWRHIQSGAAVNCGKTSEWWIHPRGYSLEVLATVDTLPTTDAPILDTWQATFMRLCRTGKILDTALHAHDKGRAKQPLMEYTKLLRGASHQDLHLAILDALG